MYCPTRDNLFPAGSSCVCIEANAKNSYGGYAGIHRTIAYFPQTGGILTSDGGLIGFQDICQNLSPFPELASGQATAQAQRSK
jgi:hypothetical protein